ncbi:hypothetical protein ABZ915_34760 [Streptomyces sp. NPDC046915]|uniref:hypothetical protein n=1 Tax=Streptomyces sp. NPDC046915 TaxID=3155257 RepID=UPI0033DDC4A1
MARTPHVTVQPPSPAGGRRVRVDGTILETAYGITIYGVAYGITDFLKILHRAGIEVNDVDFEDSPLITWRGGGPDVWPSPTTT